jgi:hypothetical protein
MRKMTEDFKEKAAAKTLAAERRLDLTYSDV